MNSTLNKIATTVMTFIANIHWQRIQAFINGGIYYSLQEQDLDQIRALLKPNYYFILTRRRCHLTTYLTSIATFFTTGKLGYYSHALFNVDDGTAMKDSDYKLIEATEPGVHFSTFMQVFDVDSVALLKPRGVSDSDWVLILDKALTDLGKPYDNLFNVLQDQQLDCVELCRNALQALPDYSTKFASFEAMIQQYGNKLTPDMFYTCPDFEIIYEVRR